MVTFPTLQPIPETPERRPPASKPSGWRTHARRHSSSLAEIGTGKPSHVRRYSAIPAELDPVTALALAQARLSAAQAEARMQRTAAEEMREELLASREEVKELRKDLAMSRQEQGWLQREIIRLRREREVTKVEREELEGRVKELVAQLDSPDSAGSEMLDSAIAGGGRARSRIEDNSIHCTRVTEETNEAERRDGRTSKRRYSLAGLPEPHTTLADVDRTPRRRSVSTRSTSSRSISTQNAISSTQSSSISTDSDFDDPNAALWMVYADLRRADARLDAVYTYVRANRFKVTDTHWPLHCAIKDLQATFSRRPR